MTANIFDEDGQVKDAGMNGHIGKPFDANLLFDYPFVANFIEELAGLPFDSTTSVPSGAIDPEKIVRVSEKQWRDEIICSTDAFGVGYTPHAAYTEAMGLSFIPLKEKNVVIYAITPSSGMKPAAKRFLQYVKELLDTTPY